MATARGSSSASARELHALVRALSAACAADANVLKDGALVDALEATAKQILSARKGRRRAPPTLSPVVNKASKKLKEVARAGESKTGEGVAKRRKLSADDRKRWEQSPSGGESPIRCRSPFLFPATERRQKPLEPDEFVLSSVSERLEPLAGASVVVRPVAVRAYRVSGSSAGADGEEEDGDRERGGVSTRKASGKSPRVTGKDVRSASPVPDMSLPFRSLDRGAVDLSASMASTLASCYDDAGEEEGERARRGCRSPAMDARAWSPMSDATDWSPVEDEGEGESPGDVGTASASEASGEDEEAYFSASEDAAAPPPARPALTRNPTEVVMEVIYGIMKDDANFKWLVDAGNQARVAKIVEYHLKELGAAAGGPQCEPPRESQGPAAGLARRLARCEEELRVERGARREAAAAFRAELETRAGAAAALERSLAEKEETISALLRRAEAAATAYAGSARGRAAALAAGPSAGALIKDLRESVALREAEAAQLRAALADKDRELCGLHMQLSTERKLGEEVASRLRAALARRERGGADDGGAGEEEDASDGGALPDVDALLFRSAVAKQQAVDELSAALEVVEREVGGLEARVAAKEREALALRAKHGELARALATARREREQARAERERLAAALQGQTARVRRLMARVDDKQQQVAQLSAEADARQARLDELALPAAAAGAEAA